MKAILSQPYSQLSGRNGSLVNLNLGGNPVVRSFVTPSNPQTDLQTQLRAYFNSASAAFSLLTDAERANWKNFSKILTRTNSLGQKYTMSDKGLYVEVNCYRQIDGQAITDTAPSITGSGTVLGIDSLLDDGTNYVLTFTNNTAGGFFVVSATSPLPGLQRKAQPSDYRMALVSLPACIVAQAGATTVVSAPYASWNFSWTDGDRVGVEIIPLGAGYVRGTPFTAEVLVST